MKKRYIHHKLLVCALIILSAHRSLATSSPEPELNRDIRDIVIDQAFAKAGLDKLSDEELVFLSGQIWGWKSATEGDVSGKTQSSVFSRQEKNVNYLQSNVLGDFKGWSGKTVFTLENGQVWKQVGNEKFFVNQKNPVVEIRKGFFGSYYLKVEGWGSRCRVVQVK